MILKIRSKPENPKFRSEFSKFCVEFENAMLNFSFPVRKCKIPCGIGEFETEISNSDWNFEILCGISKR